MVAALLSSSWARSVPQLVATQGLLYAIGCSLVYTPTICYLDQWFVERKGFAFGMMYAGTGVGGVVLPFAFNAALSTFSFRTVLRAYGIFLFVALLPLQHYIRPRLPLQLSRATDLAFLRSPLIGLFQLGNIIQSLGFFLPPLFLPTSTTDLGYSTTMATLTVVLFNVASVVGCVILGAMIDKYDVTICIALSALGPALSVWVLWGTATNLGIIFTFCIAYGLFAGSFSATWPGIMRKVQGTWPNASGTMVFAFLAAGRGLGNVISGPVSSYLVNGKGSKTPMTGGYYGPYMPMVIFTGASALVGGLAAFSRVRRSA